MKRVTNQPHTFISEVKNRQLKAQSLSSQFYYYFNSRFTSSSPENETSSTLDEQKPPLFKIKKAKPNVRLKGSTLITWVQLILIILLAFSTKLFEKVKIEKVKLNAPNELAGKPLISYNDSEKFVHPAKQQTFFVRSYLAYKQILNSAGNQFCKN
ncbi:hypothetical protein C3K47_09500 [Solitalea longa]|uniref:Uncharacterized protein n=1 Tax=Solitalea longa TaxID=2079460 RepID=A0A2S5A1X8_9SPHI|nr:hypothetical protein [Solitalea longa]POY36600.1 hypothetical protein C3K47_09500 [Solitalea longa]